MSDEEMKRFAEFEADMMWIEDHFEYLRAQFPDQFIGVYQGTVLSHNSDLELLLKELGSTCSEPLEELAIKFIPSEALDVLLWSSLTAGVRPGIIRPSSHVFNVNALMPEGSSSSPLIQALPSLYSAKLTRAN